MTKSQFDKGQLTVDARGRLFQLSSVYCPLSTTSLPRAEFQ